jgi:hypothetical protein
LRHNFRVIIKHSYGEEFSGLVDFSGRYRQFSVCPQCKNFGFSPNGIQRLGYCSTCEFTTNEVAELSLQLFLSYKFEHDCFTHWETVRSFPIRLLKIFHLMPNGIMLEVHLHC